jgi:hypothetical protein
MVVYYLYRYKPLRISPSTGIFWSKIYCSIISMKNFQQFAKMNLYLNSIGSLKNCNFEENSFCLGNLYIRRIYFAVLILQRTF